ncbi:MAG: Hsp20/alpha crystallin family protein [Burkholderiales bacterium]
MNELSATSLFDLDPMDFPFRHILRPMRVDMTDRAPQIKIDLSETDGQYAVKAEIPGVRKEDIDVRVDGNQVTISAEIKRDQEERKDGRVLRSERQYGYASRTFSLASAVDDSKADAKYANGVLSLILPKRAAAGTKRLSIG